MTIRNRRKMEKKSVSILHEKLGREKRRVKARGRRKRA